MPQKDRNPIIIILDDIRSTLNVGAILRTADAVKAEMVYTCGITANKNHPKVIKTSLGAEKSVPSLYRKNIELLIKNLKKKGYQIVGLEIDKNAINFWQAEYKHPIALVVGNEVDGLSKKVLNCCDMVIKIPMYGKKESLNVATATGIATYEILRDKLQKIKN